MRLTKSGNPDKRYKQTPKEDNQKAQIVSVTSEVYPEVSVNEPDAQILLNSFLTANNMILDFDVIPAGTIVTTEYGFLKIKENELVVKAKYVTS